MTFQVCLCGTAPGYPHAKDCPWPQYRATAEQEEKWDEAREHLADKLADLQGEDDEFLDNSRQDAKHWFTKSASLRHHLDGT